MDSTWVSFGLLSGGNIRGSLLTILLQKRASLRATTLRSRDLTYKAALVAEFTKNILPLFDTPVADGSEARVMRPHIHSIYSFDQVTEAHQLMSDNKNTGKILLVPSFDAAAATPPPVPVSTGGYSAISRDEL